MDPTLNHGPFTEEEDMRLKYVVGDVGVGNWSNIAVWFPGRTDRQVARRWRSISGKFVIIFQILQCCLMVS